jgi:glycosyltransferase involved in cell wall biosynthesis
MSERFKIVINGRFLTQRVTGVQRYAHELLRALDTVIASNPEVEITVLSPRMRDFMPPWRNLKHQAVGILQGHLWEQTELALHIRDAILFCPGNTAPLLSLRMAQRVVVCVHDLSYLYFPSAYDWRFRLLYQALIPAILRRADKIITVSNSEKSAIVSRFPNSISKVIAIQNGGLPATRYQIMEVTERREYVLYVGTLSRRKNFPNMLKVACELAARRKFRFIFVGSTPEGFEQTKQKIPVELRPFITFAGQIDNTEDLMTIYKKAACFLFPSFYEASPLPPIEAMACGCPVVASNIPSLIERCGDAAIYCNPESTASIASAIERIMDDPSLRDDLTARGTIRAEKYTWEKCAADTLSEIIGM